MVSPKERIIETTFELFAKQGYNSTGINQIISEAKVARQVFISILNRKKICV
jgi:AcrR family transcriptional regulator